MANSESTRDIMTLIGDQKKDFELASLCHNQTGRWLSKLNSGFQIITGIAALFVLGKDTIEWTKLEEKSGGEKFLLALSTFLNIVIEIIVIINRVEDPAKNSELHFQKSNTLTNLQKTINHRRIKCYTYDDYNQLYLEIEEKSSKLPMIPIPSWAKRRVKRQLKDGYDSIQHMRERRRNITLKRSGVKLTKGDKALYKGMDKLTVDSLREIATSSTVQKLDTHISDESIPIKYMNHEDLLDYLKCNLGIKTNNLSEKHRNEILKRVNTRLIENHLINEVSRVHGNSNFIGYQSRKRNISDDQRRNNDAYRENFSRSQVVSDILSDMMDDDKYIRIRVDNFQPSRSRSSSGAGDGPEGKIDSRYNRHANRVLDKAERVYARRVNRASLKLSNPEDDKMTWHDPPMYDADDEGEADDESVHYNIKANTEIPILTDHNPPTISLNIKEEKLIEYSSPSSEHLGFKDINPDISVNLGNMQRFNDEKNSLVPVAKINLSDLEKINSVD
jgi:hypothetical protein